MSEEACCNHFCQSSKRGRKNVVGALAQGGIQFCAVAGKHTNSLFIATNQLTLQALNI